MQKANEINNVHDKIFRDILVYKWTTKWGGGDKYVAWEFIKRRKNANK